MFYPIFWIQDSICEVYTLKTKAALIACFLSLFTDHWSAAQVPQMSSFTVSSQSVRQGDVLIITLSPYSRVPRVAVRIFGRDFEPNDQGAIYVGIDPYIKPSRYVAYLVDSGTSLRIDWYSTEIEVLERKFKEVKIQGRKPVSNIPTRQRKREAMAIEQAYYKGNKYKDYTDGKYAYPLVPIFITKEFYFKRIYRDGVNVHRGVDLRAPKGMPVAAINSGEVVLIARNFFLEGNMVILDHGSGIFSLYLHFSRIDVREGQMVKNGEIIGLSGATGSGVTGPHLHLIVKVNGIYVDPLEFIEIMNTQK